MARWCTGAVARGSDSRLRESDVVGRYSSGPRFDSESGPAAQLNRRPGDKYEIDIMLNTCLPLRA